MTISSYLPRMNGVEFDLPGDCLDVRFIMTFNRDVSDREFVLTAEGQAISTGAVSEIEGFSFSNGLKRSFVYVPKLAAGDEFRTKFFRVSSTVRRLYGEILPWADRSAAVQEALGGLAVEVSTAELGLPAGWGRLVLHGKVPL
jgi:hypothetical protein